MDGKPQIQMTYKKKGYRPINEHAVLPPVIEAELTAIWATICEQHGYYCDPKMMSRRKEFVKVRFMFYFVAYQTKMYTLEQLAIFTAKRDHSSVIHGRDKIEDLVYIMPNGRPVDQHTYDVCTAALAELNSEMQPRFASTQWQTAGYL